MNCAINSPPKRSMSPNPPSLVQFYAAVELFYPGNRRGADGPLEKTAEMPEEQNDLLEV